MFFLKVDDFKNINNKKFFRFMKKNMIIFYTSAQEYNSQTLKENINNLCLPTQIKYKMESTFADTFYVFLLMMKGSAKWCRRRTLLIVISQSLLSEGK